MSGHAGDRRSVAVPPEAEVLGTIVEIARQHLEEAHRFEVPSEDLPSRRLVADLGLDSVQLLTLAMEVENHFQITLDEIDPLAPSGADSVDPSVEGAAASTEDQTVDQTVETVADLVAAVRSALARRADTEV